MSWSENSQTLTESWPSMDIPQSSQSDVMTSILRTWLAKIVWKRSSRTRPNNACVLQAAIFGSPLFFCCLKILLFDASLSHKMIDIWSSCVWDKCTIILQINHIYIFLLQIQFYTFMHGIFHGWSEKAGPGGTGGTQRDYSKFWKWVSPAFSEKNIWYRFFIFGKGGTNWSK